MTTNHKGKFRDRLKRIIFFRKKRPVKNEKQVNIEDSSKIYVNYLKVTAAVSDLVYGPTIANNIEKSEKKDMSYDSDMTNKSHKDISYDSDMTNKSPEKESFVKKNSIKPDVKKHQKRQLVESISINKIINEQNHNKKTILNDSKVDNHDDNLPKIKELEKSILNLIKKDLIKIVNEMEILQSELYILSEVNGNNKTLKECQEQLNNVKNMLCKIDKLKEQYDFLKDNYDFEYLLEIDNNDIVDKIIELRDLCGTNELKVVAEDYKLLDIYKYLYLKVDDLQEKMIIYEDKKEEECLKLKERDIDFEDLKQKVYNVEYINSNYVSFVNNQNALLNEIDKKNSEIVSYEQVSYHLKGFGKLFANSFKYFGLLMISPLKGVIPSIATETLITGNLIKNLYNNLEWEKHSRIVYEAIDYSNLLSKAVSDLESTSSIVDNTLDDIVHLKMKYNDYFKQYQNDFLEYRDIMHKINDMENKILGNKIKIEIMKKRALEQQHVNEKKLLLVKEMNKKEA